MQVILEKTGDFIVETTTSARSALDLIRSRPYDVILSDYRLVRMSGHEFLNESRLIKPGIPFIFFTGMEKDEVGIRPSPGEAVSYLQKRGDPAIQFAELEDRIRSIIQR